MRKAGKSLEHYRYEMPIHSCNILVKISLGVESIGEKKNRTNSLD